MRRERPRAGGRVLGDGKPTPSLPPKGFEERCKLHRRWHSQNSGRPSVLLDYGCCWHFKRCYRYCSDVDQRKSTKLCTILGRLLGWYTMYTFWGLLRPYGILPGAEFTLRPSLAFSYVGSVTAQHSSSGHQPNYAAWYKVWNYGTFAPRHFQQHNLYSEGGHHVGHTPTFYTVGHKKELNYSCL